MECLAEELVLRIRRNNVLSCELERKMRTLRKMRMMRKNYALLCEL